MERTEEILQAARAFGEALRQDAAVQELQRAAARAQDDPEVSALEERVVALYHELVGRQQAGEMVASHEINGYYNLRERLVRHPLIVERQQRQKAVQLLFQQAGSTLSSALTVEYSALVTEE
jgi:cell fate (sporulation/competence/biofilm development) regulator YmcA (YheA/YmcA/DUF963 family)